MDGLTIAWYVATLTILLTFGLVVVFTKTKCGLRPIPPQPVLSAKPQHIRPTAPPTPAPAYAQFAPPSYDDAISNLPRIFVISINEITPHPSSSSSSASEIPNTPTVVRTVTNDGIICAAPASTQRLEQFV